MNQLRSQGGILGQGGGGGGGGGGGDGGDGGGEEDGGTVTDCVVVTGSALLGTGGQLNKSWVCSTKSI